eukprot:9388527-Pyramimonas_sp.AAC.1
MRDIPDIEQIDGSRVLRWATHVANHPPNRWTHRTLNWSPSLDTEQQGRGQHGGQQRRWDDDMQKIPQSLQPTTSDDATQSNIKEATRPRRYIHHDSNDVRWLAAQRARRDGIHLKAVSARAPAD